MQKREWFYESGKIRSYFVRKRYECLWYGKEPFTKHMASSQLLMLGHSFAPTRYSKIVKVNQVAGFDHDPGF